MIGLTGTSDRTADSVIKSLLKRGAATRKKPDSRACEAPLPLDERDNMRRTAGIALAALGLIVAVVGIIIGVVDKTESTATAVAEGGSAPYVYTAPGVLELGAETVKVKVAGSGNASVTLAFGTSDDVESWVKGLPATKITGLTNWKTLKTEKAKGGNAKGAPTLADSDMWIEKKTEKGAVEEQYRIDENNAGSISLIATSSDGKAPTVSLTWDRNLKPFNNIPIVVVGLLMALVGAALLALDHQDRLQKAEREAIRERKLARRAARANAETTVLSKASDAEWEDLESGKPTVPMAPVDGGPGPNPSAGRGASSGPGAVPAVGAPAEADADATPTEALAAHDVRQSRRHAAPDRSTAGGPAAPGSAPGGLPPREAPVREAAPHRAAPPSAPRPSGGQASGAQPHGLPQADAAPEIAQIMGGQTMPPRTSVPGLGGDTQEIDLGAVAKGGFPTPPAGQPHETARNEQANATGRTLGAGIIAGSPRADELRGRELSAEDRIVIPEAPGAQKGDGMPRGDGMPEAGAQAASEPGAQADGDMRVTDASVVSDVGVRGADVPKTAWRGRWGFAHSEDAENPVGGNDNEEDAHA